MSRSLTLLCLLVLGACASTSPPSLDIPPQPSYDSSSAWHSCRATLAWPEGTAPDFSLDVLLAYAVYRPVLAQHGEQLAFWRFHRRAARDEAGHRFSFIFRSDGVTAGRIERAIRDNVHLQWALHDGLIETLDCADGGAWSGVAMTASSDPAWPDSLQRAWPYFIQGSSQLWLELIAAEMPPLTPEIDLASLQEAAKTAQDRVSVIWRNQGRHALLHHLNAIFGYQPVLMRY